MPTPRVERGRTRWWHPGSRWEPRPAQTSTGPRVPEPSERSCAGARSGVHETYDLRAIQRCSRTDTRASSRASTRLWQEAGHVMRAGNSPPHARFSPCLRRGCSRDHQRCVSFRHVNSGISARSLRRWAALRTPGGGAPSYERRSVPHGSRTQCFATSALRGPPARHDVGALTSPRLEHREPLVSQLRELDQVPVRILDGRRPEESRVTRWIEERDTLAV
jgi:hypothetical protein